MNVNLKPETRRQGPGHVTSWRSQFAANAQKHLNLKVSKVSNNKTDEGSWNLIDAKTRVQKDCKILRHSLFKEREYPFRFELSFFRLMWRKGIDIPSFLLHHEQAVKKETRRYVWGPEKL